MENEELIQALKERLDSLYEQAEAQRQYVWELKEIYEEVKDDLTDFERQRYWGEIRDENSKLTKIWQRIRALKVEIEELENE